jgi:hypothetical protein
MSHAELETTRVHISAPNAPDAFALEQRLSHLRPVTIGVDGDWTVELEDNEDRVDEIEAAVRHWLRERGLEAASMTVDGLSRTVTAA